MAGFTPGPWAIRERSPNWEIFGDVECRWVAYAPKAVSDELRDGTFYPSLSETHANANLIAAAPELFEALVTARDYVADAAAGSLIYADSGGGFMAMAKEDLARIDAALAKAKGEK